VKVEVHVADAVVEVPSVQVVNEPVTPVSERLTVPVGVTNVPDEVSVTVTVQLELAPTSIGLVQLTVVEVVRRTTVWTAMVNVPLLRE
jgi:hypothetical protein